MCKILFVDDYDENETIVDDVILRKNRTRAPSKEEQQSNRGMLPKLLQLVDVAHVTKRVDYKTFEITINVRLIPIGFPVMRRQLDKNRTKDTEGQKLETEKQNSDKFID